MTNNTTTITYKDAFAWSKTAREFNSAFKGADFNCSPEEVCEIFEAAGINSKESYLAWRDAYRTQIALAEKMRTSIKKEVPECRHEGKTAVTRMIEIRRASKIAAGVRYKKALDKAA